MDTETMENADHIIDLGPEAGTKGGEVTAQGSYDDIKKHKTPHNNYLYILFEVGLLGLIAFLSIFYYQIRELLHKNKHNWEVLLLPLFMLILMFFDSYMFVFTITVFYIYMYKIFKISFT